jgi:hypothetical protein
MLTKVLNTALPLLQLPLPMDHQLQLPLPMDHHPMDLMELKQFLALRDPLDLLGRQVLRVLMATPALLGQKDLLGQMVIWVMQELQDLLEKMDQLA